MIMTSCPSSPRGRRVTLSEVLRVVCRGSPRETRRKARRSSWPPAFEGVPGQRLELVPAWERVLEREFTGRQGDQEQRVFSDPFLLISCPPCSNQIRAHWPKRGPQAQ